MIYQTIYCPLGLVGCIADLGVFNDINTICLNFYVHFTSIIVRTDKTVVDKMKVFMTTKENAEKWNISVRQVQNHCKNERIKGVLLTGTNYLIPKDSMKATYTYVYKSDTHSPYYILLLSCDYRIGESILKRMIDKKIVYEFDIRGSWYCFARSFGNF